jgi:hypothetical protein
MKSISTTNPHVPIVPSNGQPTTLLETVQHEARAYRAWETSTGDFLAEQLERVAQLIAWTRAASPDEYRDRLEIWDRQIADDHHRRGYADGYEAARNELGLSLEDRR